MPSTVEDQGTWYLFLGEVGVGSLEEELMFEMGLEGRVEVCQVEMEEN